MRTKITGSYGDSGTGAGTPDPEAQFFCPCHRGGSTSSLRMLKAIKGRRVAPCMKHSPCSALCLELTEDRTHSQSCPLTSTCGLCACVHAHTHTHTDTHTCTYTHTVIFFSKVLLSTHPSLKVHFHFLPTFPVCSPTCHRGYPQAPLLSDFTRRTDLKTRSCFSLHPAHILQKGGGHSLKAQIRKECECLRLKQGVSM